MKIKSLKTRFISSALAFLMIFSATSVPTSFAKDQSHTLKYYVEVKSSIDNDKEAIFNNTDQYVENYKVTFYDESDDSTFEKNAQEAETVGEVTISKDAKIKIQPKKVKPDALATEDCEFELPIFASDNDYDEYLKSQGIGNHFILRSVATNMFYVSKDEGGNKEILKKSAYLAYAEDKLKNNLLKLPTYQPTSLQFSSTNNISAIRGYQQLSFSQSGSNQEPFTYMYSTIYTYDEYNSSRTQKRHKFTAYHQKYDLINEDKGGYFGNNSNYYVNSTSDDTRNDVAVLAWTLGGAISSSDPSIYLHAAYNKAIKYTCLGVPQPIKEEYRNLYDYSSGISKHGSAFTGTSVAFNLPDYIELYDTSYGEEQLPICLIEMGAIGGWYNVGAYGGANGSVKSEYIHSYSDNTLGVSVGISAPAGIGISFSGATTSNSETAWVLTSISPR